MDSPLFSPPPALGQQHQQHGHGARVAGVALEADDPGVPGTPGVGAKSLVLETLDSLLPAASFRKAARWCSRQIEYLHREAFELHA
jgi:hypothetical protein